MKLVPTESQVQQEPAKTRGYFGTLRVYHGEYRSLTHNFNPNVPLFLSKPHPPEFVLGENVTICGRRVTPRTHVANITSGHWPAILAPFGCIAGNTPSWPIISNLLSHPPTCTQHPERLRALLSGAGSPSPLTLSLGRRQHPPGLSPPGPGPAGASFPPPRPVPFPSLGWCQRSLRPFPAPQLCRAGGGGGGMLTLCMFQVLNS